jgi:hypothetical protein
VRRWGSPSLASHGVCAYPLLLDVAAELLSALATRVVVPLMSRRRYGALT